MGLLDELEAGGTTEELALLRDQIEQMRQELSQLSATIESNASTSSGSLPSEMTSRLHEIAELQVEIAKAIKGEDLTKAVSGLEKTTASASDQTRRQQETMTSLATRMEKAAGGLERAGRSVAKTGADGLSGATEQAVASIEQAGRRASATVTADATTVVDKMEVAGERLSQARLWGALATAAYGVMPLLLTLLSLLMVVGGVLHAWEWVVLSDARAWVRAVRGVFTLAGLLAGLYGLVRLVLWVRERLERHR